jgi:phosphoribosylformimino-5-aminoimidazole carboxamide ribonucleotide (ProFAR) isomerase
MYLVTFDGLSETRDAVTSFLDSQDEITDWHTSMQNSVLVVTDLDVVALRELMRKGPVRRFLVVGVDARDFNRRVSGWLPRATWDFIKRRQPAE